MNKWFIETTKGLPKHTYLLDSTKSKMYAYKKQGERNVIPVSNAKGFLKFDSRNRTFKEVK